ncbi:MAG: hypothetical protein WBA23_09930, partial [Tunicatimonas sp.]|uniref:hypothetical protein n=1 Tax=Tunicatimonas sp. TaxID=1940096 RepID=UPI003C706BB4
ANKVDEKRTTKAFEITINEQKGVSEHKYSDFTNNSSSIRMPSTITGFTTSILLFTELLSVH